MAPVTQGGPGLAKYPRRCAASAESEMNSGQPTNDPIGKSPALPLRASRGGFGACVGEPRRVPVVRFNGTRCDTWVGFLHEAVAYGGLAPSAQADSVVIERVF